MVQPAAPIELIKGLIQDGWETDVGVPDSPRVDAPMRDSAAKTSNIPSALLPAHFQERAHGVEDLGILGEYATESWDDDLATSRRAVRKLNPFG